MPQLLTVRAPVPQKQGLKLSRVSPRNRQLPVRAPVPQKQGLKPIELRAIGPVPVVRAPVPQKQGLKPVDDWETAMDVGGVRAPVPQKQGLKQKADRLMPMRPQGSSASSTKTRIETELEKLPGPKYSVRFERQFHKNKD